MCVVCDISFFYVPPLPFFCFKVADTKTVYSVSFKGKDKKLIASDVCDSPNDLSWSYELKRM